MNTSNSRNDHQDVVISNLTNQVSRLQHALNEALRVAAEYNGTCIQLRDEVKALKAKLEECSPVNNTGNE